MTALAIRTTSYFATSRAPRYSVLFALPLLIIYEGLAALLGGDDGRTLRNGADVLLRSMFTLVVGRNGSLVFIAVVILVGVWFVAHDLKRSRGSLRPSFFFAMLGESVVLAIAFGIVVGALTTRILGSTHLLAMGHDREGKLANAAYAVAGRGTLRGAFLSRHPRVSSRRGRSSPSGGEWSIGWRPGDCCRRGRLLGIPLYRALRGSFSSPVVRI